MRPVPKRPPLLAFRAGLLLALAAFHAAGAASLTIHVVDDANVPVDDAVVYAIPKVASKKPPATAEISQVAKMFQPLVTVVQTGAAVSFPNRDTVRHHIYSFSPAKVFELKLYIGLPAAPVVFDKPGLVVLGCNIHDAMLAYVLVVDTPYFGKSTGGGYAQIELPPGDYALSIWHPRVVEQAPPRPIVVNGDQRIEQVVPLKS